MTIRDWVVEKVERAGFKVELAGDRGFVVSSGIRAKAHVYCPDASDTEPFTPDDLHDAMQEIPNLQFVAAVRRRVANDTYAVADEEGVAIGGLYALKAALDEDSTSPTTKRTSRDTSRLEGRGGEAGKANI